MTVRQEIESKALELIKAKPNGIRYMDLVRGIQEQLPSVNVNTVHGTIWDLDAKLPKEVYKPARGLYRHTSFKEAPVVEQPSITEIETKTEADFYKPFADWLVNELEECTKAIPLGGNKFKDRWGTPDVIGIRKPRQSDIIKPLTEIVSAEIKTDAGNLITAFGQACSYKLFSHKSYIVVPSESSGEDIARLDTLCRIFGIGLILFDIRDPKKPEFEIRVRAAKIEPDMFYVNKYLKLVEDALFG